MMIRGRAPLRISFGGGRTDMAPFYEEQGGAIIGNAINKYAHYSIVPKEDDQIIVNSAGFDMTTRYNTNENYVYSGKLDLITTILEATDIKQSCEVFLQCDAPPGSGLGTSSTVIVAMFVAMSRWEGIMMDAYVMADLAYQVERLDLGIDGGYQDQYAASFGGFNFTEFYGCNNVVMNPPRIKKDIIYGLQYNLLLCYTGKIHAPANIIRDQVQNYEKEDSFQAMCKAKALVYTLKDRLLRGNLHSFGKLLDYGWQNEKRMSSETTTSQADELYGEVLKAGALGGKLLGVGGGDYLLVYCPYNVCHKVVACMEQVGGQLADWNFELRRAQSWVMDDDRWQYDQATVHMLDGEYRLGL